MTNQYIYQSGTFSPIPIHGQVSRRWLGIDKRPRTPPNARPTHRTSMTSLRAGDRPLSYPSSALDLKALQTSELAMIETGARNQICISGRPPRKNFEMGRTPRSYTLDCRRLSAHPATPTRPVRPWLQSIGHRELKRHKWFSQGTGQ